MVPRHQSEPTDPSPPEAAPAGISPQVACSQAAFRRDLPQLLRDRKLWRRWVAYCGDERIGIARSEDELYQECTRRGLLRGQFVVRCIVPEIPVDLDVTPAFPV